MAEELSEVEKFAQRINEQYGSNIIDLNIETNVNENVEALPGGNIGIDVTDEIKASQQADQTRDYEYFYGEGPERPGLTTYMGAAIGAADNFITGNDTPNQAQQDVAAFDQKRAEYEQEARATYDALEEYDLPELKMLGGRIVVPPGLTDNEVMADGKVKVNRRMYTDENGDLQTAFILVPPPDSSAFERMIDQATRNILQETLGLVEREQDGSLDVNILEESDFAASVPDYEQDGAEGVFTTILTYGLPSAKATKVGSGIGRTLGIGKKSKTLLSASGGAIGASLIEGVLSTEGDQGMVFTPDLLRSTFPNKSEESLNDLAIVLDGLVLNGVVDSLLGFGGLVMGKIGDKTKGARGLVDPTFVRNEAERAAVLGIFRQIDPDLADVDNRTLAEGLRNLSEVLDANSEVLVQIGQSSAKVPVDTVNAIRNGAEQYVINTYQNMRRDIPDFDAFVEQKTNDMVQRTISLARANEGAEVLRQSQSDMLSSVGKVIDQEVARVNPDAASLSDAADSLVTQRQQQIDAAQQTQDVQEATAQGFRAQAGRAVSDDPFIQQMLSDTDAFKFFDETNYINSIKGLVSDEYLEAYTAAYKRVGEAYDRIPNAPIDVNAFKNQLFDVFNTIGSTSQVTDQSRFVMGELEKAIGSKVKPQGDNLLLADPRGELAGELTPQQFIDAVGDDLGFADLYQLKKQLGSTIDGMDRSPVRQKLIELRDHITSTAVDDNGNPVGQMAYVIANGGEAGELAQAADALFIQTQNKFAQGVGVKQLSDLAVEPAYKGANTPAPDGGRTRGMVAMDSQSVGQVVPQIMADRTGAEFDQLAFALSDSLRRDEVAKPLLDLYEAQAIDRLSKALANNDQQTIDLIDKSFDSFISELRRLESPLVSQLEDTKRRVSSVQNELGSRALAADEFAKEAAMRKAAAEQNIVAKLIDSQGRAKSSPAITLRNLISGDNAGNNVKYLVEQISTLPQSEREASMAALQGTLLMLVRDAAYTATPADVKGATVESLAGINRLTNERASGILSATAQAFPDDPFMEETLRQALGGLSDMSIASRMKISKAGSDTAANLGIRDSVSTGILFAFGYMNPTAAAARRLTAAQIEAMEKLGKERQKEIITTALAAPEELAQLAKGIADKLDEKTLMTLKREFLQAAERTLRYEARVNPKPEEDVDQQTQSMLGNVVNTLGRGVDNVVDFFRQ